MANEIQADYASGSVLYAVIRNRQGQVWRPVGQEFENWGASGHTAGDYAVALTDQSGSRHVGDLDSNIPPGSYSIQIFRQAGANPADTDALVSGREVIWTGTGELTAAKILANKAVQDKVTLAVDYYDDDGQTILLRQEWQEQAVTSTRAPQ